ncbi:MAG: ABC transporter ATP-binding protein [Xanthobacteraceae bacterium]
MLSIENLRSSYGRIEALHGVSLEVHAGEVVALLGANGAGKTTLLRAISGVQPVAAGAIEFEGRRIERMAAHRRVPLGIAQVPEGRQLFTPLSVEDNLKLGAWTRKASDIAADVARVFAMFPMLDALRHTAAGALSGGQQQMLAIGRALMARPKLVLLDEPSMGLAPILVDQIFGIVAELKRAGHTILLVEQNARAALAIADRGYVIATGRITAGASAEALLADPSVQSGYLGV